MNHPPYHLRINKAVDRMLFLDSVDKLQRLIEIDKSTYYSLAGPFLEDIRVFVARFPNLKAVTIERDTNTHLRQKFHRSSKLLKFENATVDSFLTNSFSQGKNCIFWLDYVDFKLARVNELVRLIRLVGTNSVIKFTVNISSGYNEKEIAAQSMSYEDGISLKDEFAERFSQRFDRYLTSPVTFNDLGHAEAPITTQGILKVATSMALSHSQSDEFQIVHSCTYMDGVHQMLSLTGIVTDDPQLVVDTMSDWEFANLDWASPVVLNMPDLSIKERMHLEKCLPAKTGGVRQMQKELGYEVGAGSQNRLEDYQNYHRLLPMYAKFGI